MNNLNRKFKNRPAFVGYLTGGDGGVSASVDAGLALIEGGVDILEIGVPFSDPVADGPVIQRACQRSLQAGTTPQSILEIASQIKKSAPAVSLVLFSYFNPILQSGKKFLKEAQDVGFEGALLLDLPFDSEFYTSMGEIAPILIASPSTSDLRLQGIAGKASGFIYYACQKGTTGIRSQLPDDLGRQIKRIRNVTSTPIVVGFGISDKSAAQNVIQEADGFVVGSAFVKMIEEGASPESLAKAAKQMDPRV